MNRIIELLVQSIQRQRDDQQRNMGYAHPCSGCRHYYDCDNPTDCEAFKAYCREVNCENNNLH